MDGLARVTHLGHHVVQGLNHAVERREQLADLVGALCVHAHREIALRHQGSGVGRLAKRQHDRAAQQPAKQRRQAHHHQHCNCADPLRARGIADHAVARPQRRLL